MSPATGTMDDAPDARPEIAESWHRASLAGVDQAGDFDRLVPRDIDPNSSLLIGATPVLDELEAGLAGTGYCTVLGDRECRVVRRWFDDPRIEASFRHAEHPGGCQPARGDDRHQRPGHGLRDPARGHHPQR